MHALNYIIGKYSLIVAFCTAPVLVLAQLQTNNSPSPASLVQNTLLGPGVTASNITFSGAAQAIGYFDGSNSNIGLSSGILINTGTVLNQTSFGMQEGPFGPNDLGGGGVNNNAGSNAQLEAIAGGATFNSAVLEFDFIPTGDTVRFRYVFASEEYLEFVNAGYNDVFAFFISGPGISGQQNIARVPGTNIPVTIDNVNAGSNSAYYIDNGDGSSAPQNSDWSVVQYDGFTTVLEAVSVVQPCQTYHIKLAIADVGDGIYDSGVFIEASSFSSQTTLDVNSFMAVQPYGNDTTLAEGCSEATVTFTRNSNWGVAASYPLVVSGSATPGVDCESMPATIDFAAGTGSTSLTITAYNDVLNEGDETLRLSILDPGACSIDSSTVTLILRDVPPLTVSGQNDTVWCAGTDVTLFAIVNGGLPNYSYNWSNGGTGTSITVNPMVTTDYIFTVSDNCNASETLTLTVVVPPPTPMVLSVTKDTTMSCPSMSILLEAEVTGGGQPYSYLWSNGATTPNILVTPTNTTTYYVTVIDGCGLTQNDSVIVTIDYTPITIELTPDLVICPGDAITLNVIAEGGRGSYIYNWNGGASHDQQYLVFPSATSVFTVDVTDSCGTYVASGSVVVSVNAPNALFTQAEPAEVNETSYFLNQSTGASSYYWDLGNGVTGTTENMSTVYDEEGDYEVMLIAYNDQGCSDTIIQMITIHPEFQFYVPNAFTPDGDGMNDEFYGKGENISEYEMIIFDRWGSEVFKTNEVLGRWDGTLNGAQAPVGVYVWVIRVKPFTRMMKEKRGHVTLVR